MGNISIILAIFAIFCHSIQADDVLGCGGFLKSHVPIDFSKVVVKMFTKQGILKDQTNCAPNNGYYFFPVYDKGEYVLKLEPPPGWSFTPTKIQVAVDGTSDLCSKGQDINFVFDGFGITGKVEISGANKEGPEGVSVTLKSDASTRTTETSKGGTFFFTPVYPGKYILSIGHERWKIAKGFVEVTVTEGNTELPSGSLVIKGYDVEGFVYSDKEPVKDVTIVLLPQNPEEKNLLFVDHCSKSTLPEFGSEVLCVTNTNEKGKYTFPAVSPGKYRAVPYYKDQRIHFYPPEINFVVEHGTVTMASNFEIVGFSIIGRVLDSPNGNPIKGARVFLNDTLIVTTKKDGTYILEKIDANYYMIRVKTDNYLFEERVLKVNPSLKQLPTISPIAYNICGNVLSDKSQVVKIKNLQNSETVSVNTDATNGKFCTFLATGKYEMSVDSQGGKSQNLLFFPLVHTFEVKTEPISNIVFSQLKATLWGNVSCIRPIDCKSIITLRPIIDNQPVEGKDLVIETADGKYKIEDITPGNYELSISSRKLCFENSKFPISIYSSVINVPEFKQIGYVVRFISSHNTFAKYRFQGDKTHKTIDISQGLSIHCLPKAGKYDFTLESCHTYKESVLTFDTNEENTELLLTADKHLAKVGVEVEGNLGSVTMAVIKGNETFNAPLKYLDKRYVLDLYLEPDETVTLSPRSEILYFKPPSAQITGSNDCSEYVNKFKGIEGKIYSGKIVPPLADIRVTLESDKEIRTTLTNEKGRYKFPPQDETRSYTLKAEIESYLVVGPDKEGTFYAQKLAELAVQVIDEATNLPLQGALLSLSGGESYRSNLQTNENGQITFNSLNPSEYYLRPMMKEYSFDPPSKIIDIKEGASAQLLLKGKRIAYSVFGEVTTLNGEPDNSVSVIAKGIGNCSELSEETSMEPGGKFRVRGLLPNCKYELKVKGNVDGYIERYSPSEIIIENIKQDVTGVKFVVFHAITTCDVLVKVFCTDADHYKSLKIVLSRDSSGHIYSTRLDSSNYKLTKNENYGVLVQIPAVQKDGKLYTVRLESNLMSNKPISQSFVANSSFKYVEFEFDLKLKSADQQVKRTSVWGLVFIFTVICVVLNSEYLYNWCKDHFPVANVLSQVNMPRQKAPIVETIPDTADIDQIVQNINAVKRKNKPKKL